MKLFTERNELRQTMEWRDVPQSKHCEILLNICEKYYKFLTHLYYRVCHDDFIGKNYIEFNKENMLKRLAIRIPNLFIYDVDGNPVFTIFAGDDAKYALLDFIEYIAQNIHDIQEGWNSPRYKNYWEITCLDTTSIFKNFSERGKRVL